ncbi:MAG: hypothetical protein H7141_03385 [Burkholderiales bacterium]|nr:hypothetical protein [Bacteroidia bacterium]
MIKKIITCLVVSISLATFAQDDLLDLVKEEPKNEPAKSVYATFKTTKIVNAQNIETVKKRNLDFRVTHRFGNIYNSTSKNALNEAAHSAFGLDNSTDIRISFDYGITDKLTIGIGRSKFREMNDGTIKWRFLTQKENNKIPVSVCFYGNLGYTSMTTDNLYAGTIRPKTNEAHRVQYASQLLIARKFNSWFSLQIMPTYIHRNFIKQQLNAKNGKEDENSMFSLGFGGRLKLTKRFALVADYFYNFSDFQKNNPLGYYNPLGVGIEIETGGHVFHINYTNGPAILESSLLTSTQDSWTKGQIKLGFNISRWFAL